jgi:hypothetical protein
LELVRRLGSTANASSVMSDSLRTTLAVSAVAKGEGRFF